VQCGEGVAVLSVRLCCLDLNSFFASRFVNFSISSDLGYIWGRHVATGLAAGDDVASQSLLLGKRLGRASRRR
jgi:hypothetical protein